MSVHIEREGKGNREETYIHIGQVEKEEKENREEETYTLARSR